MHRTETSERELARTSITQYVHEGTPVNVDALTFLTHPDVLDQIVYGDDKPNRCPLDESSTERYQRLAELVKRLGHVEDTVPEPQAHEVLIETPKPWCNPNPDKNDLEHLVKRAFKTHPTRSSYFSKN